MKYVIETQVRENYAAHDEDYEHGVDQPYWKNKSGSTYIVEAPGEHIDVAHEVADLITVTNEMFEETVFDVTAVDDDLNQNMSRIKKNMILKETIHCIWIMLFVEVKVATGI